MHDVTTPSPLKILSSFLSRPSPNLQLLTQVAVSKNQATNKNKDNMRDAMKEMVTSWSKLSLSAEANGLGARPWHKDEDFLGWDDAELGWWGEVMVFVWGHHDGRSAAHEKATYNLMKQV